MSATGEVNVSITVSRGRCFTSDVIHW